MRDEDKPEYLDPRKEDIVYDGRRISRPDSSMPDWYIPDTQYRPIPIAWFAAAIIVQTVVISAVFFILISKSGWLTIALAAGASAVIYAWSWDRGIKSARAGWQTATGVVMVLQFALICLGVSDRL